VDPGRINHDRTAQAPFALSVLAGQIVTFPGFFPGELACASLAESFTGSTVGLHFHIHASFGYTLLRTVS
jgi:hypothetical protein